MTSQLNTGQQVLIVDDDPQLVRILQAVLAKLEGIEILVAGTGRRALQMLEDQLPAMVLLDMRLPDLSGMEILAEIRGRAIPVTIIVMTAHGSVDLAVDAMRQGAYDFLTKPLDFERLKVMVRNALERHQLIQELDNYRSSYERAGFRGLRGSSPAMQRLYRQIRTHARSAAPILVTGEMGTETDVAARALHDEAQRTPESFVAIDCATLEAQAQTAGIHGASARAAGGTLLLQNVTALGKEAQSALFEMLQSGEYPGGDGKPAKVDFRIVASADDSIKSRVEEYQFDEDLYYALNMLAIRVPPLRDRGEDVLDFAESLLEEEAETLGREPMRLGDEAVVAFMTHNWPGNAGEMREVVKAMAAGGQGRTVTRAMLPGQLAALVDSASAPAEQSLRGLETRGVVRPLWIVEKEAIEKALELCEGNVIQAARLLDISPATIYRKQQSWRARGS
ncbi:MAG: two-component system, repressor protein LuxO [Candidatus Sumerlaeota bacterium]|nr:two-component system, repressor protein LuxO [Candidatus Sumerlaeota bacterium]